MSLSSNNPGENFRISCDNFPSCPHSKIISSYFCTSVYCTCPPYFHQAGPLSFNLFKMSASNVLLYLVTPIILPALPTSKKKKHASMLPYFLSLLLIPQHGYQGVCPFSSLFWLIPFSMLLLIIKTLKQTFLASLLLGTWFNQHFFS